MVREMLIMEALTRARFARLIREDLLGYPSTLDYLSALARRRCRECCCWQRIGPDNVHHFGESVESTSRFVLHNLVTKITRKA